MERCFALCIPFLQFVLRAPCVVMMVHFPAGQTTISFNASNDYHDHSRFRDFHGADTAYSQSSSAKTICSLEIVHASQRCQLQSLCL
jgi:hypothetical protein